MTSIRNKRIVSVSYLQDISASSCICLFYIHFIIISAWEAIEVRLMGRLSLWVLRYARQFFASQMATRCLRHWSHCLQLIADTRSASHKSLLLSHTPLEIHLTICAFLHICTRVGTCPTAFSKAAVKFPLTLSSLSPHSLSLCLFSQCKTGLFLFYAPIYVHPSLWIGMRIIKTIVKI